MFKKTLVGVDLGAHSIKCAVLRSNEASYIIIHKKEYPLSEAGNKTLVEYLEDVLFDFVKSNRIKNPLFCLSLPYAPPKTLVMILDLPLLPDKDIARSIPFEIQKRMLVQNMETVFYKWSILQKTQEKIKVLLVVMEKDVVREILGSKKLSRMIKVIEPQFVSLSRIVTGNVMLVDLGHTGTRVIVCRDGKPVYLQQINVGGLDITKAIKDKFSLDDLSQAEKVKHEEGAMDEDYRVSVVAADPVKILLEEMSNIVQSIRVNEGLEVDEVYYTGNAGALKFLPEHLSRAIGCDVKPLNLTSDSLTAGEDYSYAVACGAALFEDVPDLQGINFANVKDTGPAGEFSVKVLFFVALAAGLLFQLGVAGLQNIAESRLEKVTAWHEEVEAQIEAYERQNQIYAMQLQQYRNIRSLIDRDKESFSSDILRILIEKTPKNIYVEEVSIDAVSGLVKLKGLSPNYSDIGFFAIALEELFWLEIDTIEEVPEGHRFTINLSRGAVDEAHEEVQGETQEEQ